jgi:endogenous inhibitor of DNA gyrase (YacG/DUF329 family)
MTTEPVLRRCAGCQAHYRRGTGYDPFCSTVCATAAGMRSILAGLERFAADQQARHTESG